MWEVKQRDTQVCQKGSIDSSSRFLSSSSYTKKHVCLETLTIDFQHPLENSCEHNKMGKGYLGLWVARRVGANEDGGGSFIKGRAEGRKEGANPWPEVTSIPMDVGSGYMLKFSKSSTFRRPQQETKRINFQIPTYVRTYVVPIVTSHTHTHSLSYQ